jgi:Flp pilus assembly protein TadG
MFRLLPPRKSLARFLTKEDGALTILAIYFLLITLVIGGMAIDFNKLIADRTRLQITADSVAHAALHYRQTGTEVDSLSEAMKITDVMLPDAYYISFGDWDTATSTFTANPGSKGAVQVYANQLESRGNEIRNIVLGMIGFDSFESVRSTVFTTYLDPCYTNGFQANGVVDIQSNNTYVNNFCIHSNSYVSLNNVNSFGPNVRVSMPDLANLQLPNSGFTIPNLLQNPKVLV